MCSNCTADHDKNKIALFASCITKSRIKRCFEKKKRKYKVPHHSHISSNVCALSSPDSLVFDNDSAVSKTGVFGFQVVLAKPR